MSKPCGLSPEIVRSHGCPLVLDLVREWHAAGVTFRESGWIWLSILICIRTCTPNRWGPLRAQLVHGQWSISPIPIGHRSTAVACSLQVLKCATPCSTCLRQLTDHGMLADIYNTEVCYGKLGEREPGNVIASSDQVI